MSSLTILNNARIVLPDRIVHGTVALRDGRIADISDTRVSTGEDMEGDFLIPGLVELHTDHLEGHYAPRPTVRWNPVAAVLAHDGQVAASGITTVFDALRIGLDEDSAMFAADMRALASAVRESQAADRLRADHYIHLRCEVCAPDCMESFELYGEDDRIRLVSLMDHSPGQRQFTTLEKYRMYYIGKMSIPEDEFDAFCSRRIAESEQHSAPTRRALSRMCRERGIVLASHDDATIGHVDEAVTDGIRIAEFPTTLEAARASREAGMSVLMGAPNVIRGASHSGNVSARTLAENGCLDILSSDYIPFSLIQAAFHLSQVVDEIALPDAVAMVSKNPAEAVGLSDRGVIEPGRRADIVRVRFDGQVPVVRAVWREGRRVS